MILGNISQEGTHLFTDNQQFVSQWGENISLSVSLDGTFNGYSFVWLVAYDRAMMKTDYLSYDAENQILTIPAKALKKAGHIYVTLRAMKENETIPCTPVGFLIKPSGNPNADNSPHEPGWEEIAKGLFEQFFSNKYVVPVEEATKRANDAAQDANTALQEMNATQTQATALIADVNAALQDMNTAKIQLNALIADANTALQDMNITKTQVNALIADANTALQEMNATKIQINAMIADINTTIQEIYPIRGTFSGDIDTCKEIGCHYCNFANTTNGPYTSGYGWIEVKKSGETLIQEIYRHSTSGVSEKAVRDFANSKWYPWRKILTAEI